MKVSTSNAGVAALVCTLSLLLMTVSAAPMQAPEEEEVENGLVVHPDNMADMTGQWDTINTEALRKLLMQLDEERLARASRSWPQTEPRGWGLRNIDSRIARQWRADKRQVRFRQCYFNPISCFRK